MRVVVASIFLFIFSFQVMPVKELGKLLFKNSITEEIHEVESDEAENTGGEVKKGNEPYTASKMGTQYYWLVLSCGSLGLASPEHVPKQYIPDILTPPPNRA